MLILGKPAARPVPCAIEKWICFVVRIIFKIHLRNDFVLSTAYLEVDVCRSHPV